MRNKKIPACLCMTLLLATTGCGSSDADLGASTADTINFSEVIDVNVEENNSNHQNDSENADYQRTSGGKSNSQHRSGGSTDQDPNHSAENDDIQQDNHEELPQQSDVAQPQAEGAQLEADAELDGSIESIGDNSVVINQTFHPSADVAVSYAEDSEKTLVTVYFSEKTEFEVWTVKNGGVNGDADTEKRQGAFSDLKQGANLSMTGSYNGNVFHVKNVIIYYFV